MSAFWIYNLKVGVCLAVFYLFFKLCMSRETCHRFNRVLVLMGAALSFVLPLVVVTFYREIPILSEPDPEPVSVVTVADPATVNEISWKTILGGCIFLGSMVMLVRSLWMLREVWRVIARGRKELMADGTVLVKQPCGMTPFSWGRYIVLAEEDLNRSGKVIITHEQAHCHLHHTADLLLLEVMGWLQWFNPAMWLLKRDLRELHEYEADEAVLRSGVDAREYQLLLIKKAVGGRWYSVANCFNHSKLKNRITMMLQKRSSKWAGVKALLLLPLVGCAIGAFAETVYVPVAVDKGTKNISITEENCRLTVQVFDEQQKPLPGAIIRWDNDGQAITDKEGIAQLNNILQGTVISVKYAGFTPMMVEVPRQNEASLALSLQRDGSPKEQGRSMKFSLIVVDGQAKGSDFDLKDIDSKKIASMTVLKGESATDKYGDKGRNGAIEVTLRKEGEPVQALEVSNGGDNVRVITNVNSTLEGKVAGVQMTTADSQSAKAGQPILVIKGNSFVEDSGKKRLIVVDGQVKGTDFDLKDIDSKKIASMTVLKGESATNKYGDKGRNGAIEVTLKKEGDRYKTWEVLHDGGNVQIIGKDDQSAKVGQTIILNRGMSSDGNLGKRPLIVIDGQVMGRGYKKMDIDSKRIASMTVLKGKSATDKYGDKGRDGAIEMTLKEK